MLVSAPGHAILLIDADAACSAEDGGADRIPVGSMPHAGMRQPVKQGGGFKRIQIQDLETQVSAVNLLQGLYHLRW